jgi:hypothetical protein
MAQTLGGWGTALADTAIVVGMLVVVPLGLELLELVRYRRWWFAGAVPGAVSLWLPRGGVAVALATLYALAAGLVAAQARVRRPLRPVAVAMLTALVAPAVAGTSLVAERAGYQLFGFELTTLTLTVAHFHYAGFAAALIAGLACGAAPDSRPGQLAALTVPSGIALVFAGFFTGEEVELAGTAVLTAGMWLVAWLTWQRIRPMAADRLTAALFGVSAVVLVATMALALDWALGEAFGVAHLPLRWMAATHGLGNAAGFAICGLLAWRRVSSHRPSAKGYAEAS